MSIISVESCDTQISKERGANMGLYENIRIAAIKKGTNIMQIERDLHYARGSLYKWNTNNPNVFKVDQVAKHLGCTIEDLLGKEE